MKRTVFVLAGLVVVAALVYVGRLWAQSTAPRPAAPLRTRVALVNLRFVIPNCNKFKQYQQQMKATLDPYQAKDTAKKKLLADTTVDMQKPENASQRDKLEETARRLKREIEDNKEAANKIMQKNTEEQVVILYKDVQTAVARYAQAHDFELVLSYHEGISQEEFFSGANVFRKMRETPCIPLYWSQGMDVSAEIVKMLNGSTSTPTAAAPPRSGT